jgi:hypothetical protein
MECATMELAPRGKDGRVEAERHQGIKASRVPERRFWAFYIWRTSFFYNFRATETDKARNR